LAVLTSTPLPEPKQSSVNSLLGKHRSLTPQAKAPLVTGLQRKASQTPRTTPGCWPKPKSSLTGRHGVKICLPVLAKTPATCGHGAMHHHQQWVVVDCLEARDQEQLLVAVA
jgi:hypothetical protein